MSARRNEITPAVRSLLSAISDALDVPFPRDYDDWEKHHQVLSGRAAITRGALQAIVDDGEGTLAAAASTIRKYSSELFGYEPCPPEPRET